MVKIIKTKLKKGKSIIKIKTHKWVYNWEGEKVYLCNQTYCFNPDKSKYIWQGVTFEKPIHHKS